MNENQTLPTDESVGILTQSQVNEIKEGVEDVIAVVKENSDNRLPVCKKKGH